MLADEDGLLGAESKPDDVPVLASVASQGAKPVALQLGKVAGQEMASRAGWQDRSRHRVSYSNIAS